MPFAAADHIRAVCVIMGQLAGPYITVLLIMVIRGRGPPRFPETLERRSPVEITLFTFAISCRDIGKEQGFCRLVGFENAVTVGRCFFGHVLDFPEMMFVCRRSGD